MVYHRKISKIKNQISKRNSIILIFIIICLLYYFFKLFTDSVFLKGRDKINVVFYGENTRFFSLDKENISYLLAYKNSTRIIVPGGYGEYKVGAIGKLVSLENKPDIIRKTFSAATSALVDLYFYPKAVSVYYQNGSDPEKMPDAKEIFLTNSNANLLDRFLLFYFVNTSDRKDYQTIDLKPFELGYNNGLFDSNGFYKKFQGSFFQKTYRNIDINVQIFYTNSYKTGLLLSQMIEGEGIRVVDLSKTDKSITGCQLITSKEISLSKTYQRLQNFFNCHLVIGETTVSDIILVLGDQEKEWAVN
jgi:hypothetical protein